MVDARCKKIVTTVYENKLARIESEMKELAASENNVNATNKATKSATGQTKGTSSLKASEKGGGSYAARNDTI